jgi:aspartyl-tRNA(Asn)/glutamyl-tRNA(Gln) amidotransferase subunit A
MASSLDVIGPITMSVKDASVVLDVIAGRDELDSTTIEREESYTDLPANLKGKKVGVIKEYMDKGLDSGVKQQIDTAVEKIKAAGAEITEVSLPSLPLALAVYYIVCPAEVSSNLSRYDGQRYGYTYKEAQDLDESFSKTRSIGFGKEAKRRIMLGTYVLSSGYYDAYYKQAQTVRTKLIEEFRQAFNSVDFLLGPTAPTTAFKIGENVADPLKMYLTDIMTVAVNLVGVPAISVPAGISSGLPVGLQLIAPQRNDRKLLAFANQAEGVIG